MVDDSAAAWGAEAALAAVCLASGIYIMRSIPIPANMTWIQSRGKLIVEAGWRSPQQRRQFLLHLATLGLATSLVAVLRNFVVEKPHDIDSACACCHHREASCQLRCASPGPRAAQMTC